MFCLICKSLSVRFQLRSLEDPSISFYLCRKSSCTLEITDIDSDNLITSLTKSYTITDVEPPALLYTSKTNKKLFSYDFDEFETSNSFNNRIVECFIETSAKRCAPIASKQIVIDVGTSQRMMQMHFRSKLDAETYAQIKSEGFIPEILMEKRVSNLLELDQVLVPINLKDKIWFGILIDNVNKTYTFIEFWNEKSVYHAEGMKKFISKVIELEGGRPEEYKGTNKICLHNERTGLESSIAICILSYHFLYKGELLAEKYEEKLPVFLKFVKDQFANVKVVK